ncbi:MAG: ATP-dependent helicase C-terminal domain-containing protein, partial [Pseudomonadota bacterium]
VAREVVRLGSVDLTSRPVPLVLDETVASALALGLAAGGIGALPWSKAQNQLRQRVQFLKALGGEDACDGLPDLGDAELADTVETWLTPYLIGLSRAGEVTADVLGQALDGMLPWDAKTRIEQMTPSHFRAPTGSLVRIDYGGDRAPSVSVRVQEVFGLGVHPTVLKGAVPLTMELLSPARRPIQMTRDLPGFWTGSWADVRAEMRGRYPKHVWPEDPSTAAPTSRVKPR